MKKTLLTAAAALGFCLGAPAGIITQWNFNDSDGNAATGTLVPSIGTGAATTVGGLPTTYNAPAGSSDPLGGDPNNSCWRMASGFPAQSTGNKTAGVQFTVGTTGYQNITLTWDQANSATANKYWRVQYSIDNGANWVDKDVIINYLSATWNNPIATVSFASVPGANNNANFMVRIVSELASTADGGAANYVAVGGGTYSTSGTLRLDMVTFSGDIAGDNFTISTDPASQTVAVGQPASFSVSAGGGNSALTYQWRKNSSTVTGATQSAYTIAAAQLTDAASYDVVVANAVMSLTSGVAVLTVRTPASLAWTGANGSSWDTFTTSWVNTNSPGDVAYIAGDHVLFDIRGASANYVSLGEELKPSSVTVNADSDYTLTSVSGGKIAGATGLAKRGAGTLFVDADNSYTGPTVIEAGTVQLGANTASGLLGTGPLTNNGALVFNRIGSFELLNNITCNGSLTNNNKSRTTVTLSGTNVYNGPIAAKSGYMQFRGNQRINSTDVYVTPSADTGLGGTTRFGIAGGVVASASTTLHLQDSTFSPDCRTTLYSSSGSNVWNGSIIINGGGANSINADNAGTELHINGSVSGNLAAPGSLLLRGSAGTGFLSGTITLPNAIINKTDAGSTWVISSTGNSWAATVLAQGTLRIGANNALPTGINLVVGQATGTATATFDLGGFNQQLSMLSEAGGTEIIGNSSTVSDSTLTVGFGTFSGVIQDSVFDGTRKTSFTLNGTTFTLAGANTYSGETTVAAGLLSLSGSIANSPVINLAGGSLDVSGRGDQTLYLGIGQKLKGNGAFAITGNLTCDGTIELKVNKANGVITSNDRVNVSGQIACGGTLKVVLSGAALVGGDNFKLFDAGAGCSGAFSSIEPAIPAAGYQWDTRRLATEGVLRVLAPEITTTTMFGTDLTISGTSGPANGSYSVVASPDVAAPLATWTAVQTGSFDGDGNFSVTIATTPSEPRKFFRVSVP